MRKPFEFPLEENPRELGRLEGWSKAVCTDFGRLQQGKMTQADFDDKYLRVVSILVLDMTGFTVNAMRGGQIHSLLRIFDAQKVCVPVLRDFGAELIRTFADDMVALFPQPLAAVDAAMQVHERVIHFNESDLAGPEPTECCIGIGYGNVYAIGPNLAMGDEMNRAAKLGEDIARSKETLLTENAFENVRSREDLTFKKQTSDDDLFPYYRADRKKPAVRKASRQKITIA